ncbi:hypothetical protein LCGC14_2610060 [marine sediment metagenome]|uniref:Uncharacterized protein n=1 Tax=marine sediment metagenome TaxID=412755 RepID=A0A0F9A653_9ZZZZ
MPSTLLQEIYRQATQAARYGNIEWTLEEVAEVAKLGFLKGQQELAEEKKLKNSAVTYVSKEGVRIRAFRPKNHYLFRCWLEDEPEWFWSMDSSVFERVFGIANR